MNLNRRENNKDEILNYTQTRQKKLRSGDGVGTTEKKNREDM